MVLVTAAVRVVHGQAHALGLTGDVLAVVGKREARRGGGGRVAGQRGPGYHLVCGRGGIGEARIRVRDIVALVSDAAVGRVGLGHVQRRPALVKGVRATQALLHEDGDVGQAAAVIAGHVRPDLDTLDKHGVRDAEDEGAVLTQGRLDALDALVLALGPRDFLVSLVPLGMARVALARAALDILVVEHVVVRAILYRRRDGGVVDDFLAVGVVLGQVLDGGALVVLGVDVIVAPVGVHGPPHAVVTRDYLRRAVGVDGVQREVHVRPLVEVFLDELVVPAGEVGDVLGAAATVGEGVRALVAVLQVGVVRGIVRGAHAHIIRARSVLAQRLGDVVAERLALVVVLGEAVDAETVGVVLGNLNLQHAGEVRAVGQHVSGEALRVSGVEIERVGRGVLSQLGIHVAVRVSEEDTAGLTGNLIVGGRTLGRVCTLINPRLGEHDVHQTDAAVGDDDLRPEEVVLHAVGDVVDIAALVGNRVLTRDETPGAVGPGRQGRVAVDVGHVGARPVEDSAVNEAHALIVVVGNLAYAVIEAVARAGDEALGNILAFCQVHGALGLNIALGVPTVGVLQGDRGDHVARLDGVALGIGQRRAVGLHDIGLSVNLDSHGITARGVAIIDPLLGEAHRGALAAGVGRVGRVGDRREVDDLVVLGAIGLGEVVGVRGGLVVVAAAEALNRRLHQVVQVLGAGLVVLGEAVHVERPGAGLAIQEVDDAVAVHVDARPILVHHAVGDEAIGVEAVVLIQAERNRIGEGHRDRVAGGVGDVERLGAVGVLDARDGLAVHGPILGHAGRGVIHVGVHDGLVGDGAILGHVGRVGALEHDRLILALLVLEDEDRAAGDAGIRAARVGGEALNARAGDVHLAPLVHELMAHEVIAGDVGGNRLLHVAREPTGELDGVADGLPGGVHGVQARLGVGLHAVGLGVAHELHGHRDVAQLILIGAGNPGLGELGVGAADADIADGAMVIDDDVVLGGGSARLDVDPLAVDELRGVVIGLVVGDGHIVVVVLGEGRGDALIAVDGLLAQEVHVGIAVGVVLGQIVLDVDGELLAQADAGLAGGNILLGRQRELDKVTGGVGNLGGRGHRAAVGGVAIERVRGLGPVGGAVVVPVLGCLEVDGAGMGQRDVTAVVGGGDVGAVVGDVGVAVVHLIVVDRAVVRDLQRRVGIVDHGVVERRIVGVVLRARGGNRHDVVVDGDGRGLVGHRAGGNHVVVEMDGLGLVIAEGRVPLVEGIALLEHTGAVAHDDAVRDVLHALEALDGLVGTIVRAVESAVVSALGKLRVTLYLTFTNNLELKLDRLMSLCINVAGRKVTDGEDIVLSRHRHSLRGGDGLYLVVCKAELLCGSREVKRGPLVGARSLPLNDIAAGEGLVGGCRTSGILIVVVGPDRGEGGFAREVLGLLVGRCGPSSSSQSERHQHAEGDGQKHGHRTTAPLRSRWSF